MTGMKHNPKVNQGNGYREGGDSPVNEENKKANIRRTIPVNTFNSIPGEASFPIAYGDSIPIHKD
jgi:hypothetical protein